MSRCLSYGIRCNEGLGRLCIVFLGAGLLALPDRAEAQADSSWASLREPETKDFRAGSVYFYIGVGNSWPIHPDEFHSADWQDGLELRFSGGYWLTEGTSILFGIEHFSLSTATVTENPEIRSWRYLATLSLTRATGDLKPYVSVTAGVVRQGFRRMFIREDGSFVYTLAVSDFEWSVGPTFDVAAGMTLDLTAIAFPFGEVSYATNVGGGLAVGRVTVRGGVALSPNKLLESIVEGFRKLRRG